MAFLKQSLILFFTVWLVWATPAPAQPGPSKTATPVPPIRIIRTPHFHLPINCTIGTDCWVLNYADIGPDKDGVATDAACNARTYEDHKGTDIAIPDEASMKRGVDVLAAQSGTVTRVRDGEEDHFNVTKEQLDKIKADKKECGNAVLIDHGGGWQSLYCHMKKGSIMVKPDTPIKEGEKIGQVGVSGMTQFPHIHFGLTHNNMVVDPFTGLDIREPCGKTGGGLWEKSAGLAYQPLTFFDMGFDTAAPDLASIDRERKDRKQLRDDAPALVFHAVLLGVRDGDAITLKIEGPDGEVFAVKQSKQEKTRARQMLFVGRKVPNGLPLKPGIYTGKAAVIRTGKDGKEQQFADQRSLTVE
jgi:hypothetical protein